MHPGVHGTGGTITVTVGVGVTAGAAAHGMMVPGAATAGVETAGVARHGVATVHGVLMGVLAMVTAQALVVTVLAGEVTARASVSVPIATA